MNEDIIKMLKTGQDDLKWFNANFSNLLEKYNEKFIAFYNKEIIDSDTDLNRLMSKLESRNINTSNVIVRYISKIKSIL